MSAVAYGDDLDNDILDLFDLPDIAGQPLEDRIRLAHQLERTVRTFAYLRSEVGALIFNDWPTNDDGHPEPFVAVDGCPPVVRETGGKRTKWDGTGLRSVLAAQVADEVVDRSTGEVPPLATVTARAMEVVAECAGLNVPSASWRVTPLKARGINPSLFCEYVAGDQQKVRFQ